MRLSVIMKRAANLVLVAALTITCALSVAQVNPPSTSPVSNSVRLVLILGNREGASGPEEILTIRLSNEGKTSVSFPEPVRFCGSPDGFVMVYTRILSHSVHDGLGKGCAYDRAGPRTDVLAEAKNWKKLAPKDVYEFTVSLRGDPLLLNTDGRYELRAKYYPPYLGSAELKLLAANGVTVVQEPVESPPLIVEPR